jgi:hypothetical protein
MDQHQRAQRIAQYKDGYRIITDALEGITPAELDAREAPGEWSPRQVIHHLADSEMTSAIRLRRMVVEDGALIQGYDQEAFADLLYYDRPVEASLAAFKAARDTTAQLLDRLTEEQWRHTGTHTESGAYSVTIWLEIYAVHAHEHAEQIRRARAQAQARA